MSNLEVQFLFLLQGLQNQSSANLMPNAHCCRQARRPHLQGDMQGMPQKVRVEASDVYGKSPPSDSTPGSWNIPLNPLASDQKVPASGGLTIDSQDMRSVPQLGSDASSSKGTALTLSDKSSGHRRSTKSGIGSVRF